MDYSTRLGLVSLQSGVWFEKLTAIGGLRVGETAESLPPLPSGAELVPLLLVPLLAWLSGGAARLVYNRATGKREKLKGTLGLILGPVIFGSAVAVWSLASLCRVPVLGWVLKAITWPFVWSCLLAGLSLRDNLFGSRLPAPGALSAFSPKTGEDMRRVYKRAFYAPLRAWKRTKQFYDFRWSNFDA